MSSGYATGRSRFRLLDPLVGTLRRCSNRGVFSPVVADCFGPHEVEDVARGLEQMSVGEAGRDRNGRQSSRVRFPNSGELRMFPSESYEATMLFETMFKPSVEVPRGIQTSTTNTWCKVEERWT
jgi:hypothetical protein